MMGFEAIDSFGTSLHVGEEECCYEAPKERSRAIFDMHYVYILKSQKDLSKIYIGCTTNLTQRVKQHNYGSSSYSKKYAPWQLETYLAFHDANKARQFEIYLKSGSGHAFLKKRLLPDK